MYVDKLKCDCGFFQTHSDKILLSHHQDFFTRRDLRKLTFCATPNTFYSAYPFVKQVCQIHLF